MDWTRSRFFINFAAYSSETLASTSGVFKFKENQRL